MPLEHVVAAEEVGRGAHSADLRHVGEERAVGEQVDPAAAHEAAREGAQSAPPSSARDCKEGTHWWRESIGMPPCMTPVESPGMSNSACGERDESASRSGSASASEEDEDDARCSPRSSVVTVCLVLPDAVAAQRVSISSPPNRSRYRSRHSPHDEYMALIMARETSMPAPPNAMRPNCESCFCEGATGESQTLRREGEAKQGREGKGGLTSASVVAPMKYCSCGSYLESMRRVARGSTQNVSL